MWCIKYTAISEDEKGYPSTQDHFGFHICSTEHGNRTSLCRKVKADRNRVPPFDSDPISSLSVEKK